MVFSLSFIRIFHPGFIRNSKFFILFLPVIFFISAVPAHSTTFKTEQLPCPVCGTTAEVTFVASTNTFGGVSRDGMPKSIGCSPVLIAPSTCPKCLFSGMAEDFKEPSPSITALKPLILESKKLSLPAPFSFDPVSDPSNLPAWMKYDLIRQINELGTVETEIRASTVLSLTWAMRLRYSPSDFLSKEKNEKLEKFFAGLQIPASDKCPSEEASFMNWVDRQISKSEGEELENFLLIKLAIELSEGEHERVNELLLKLESLMEKDMYASFRKQLLELEERMKFYEKEALVLFEKLISDSDPDLENKNKLQEEEKKDAIIFYTYIAAELARRTGDLEKAKKYYERVESTKELPPFVEENMKNWKDFFPASSSK